MTEEGGGGNTTKSDPLVGEKNWELKNQPGFGFFPFHSKFLLVKFWGHAKPVYISNKHFKYLLNMKSSKPTSLENSYSSSSYQALWTIEMITSNLLNHHFVLAKLTWRKNYLSYDIQLYHYFHIITTWTRIVCISRKKISVLIRIMKEELTTTHQNKNLVGERSK